MCGRYPARKSGRRPPVESGELPCSFITKIACCCDRVSLLMILYCWVWVPVFLFLQVQHALKPRNMLPHSYPHDTNNSIYLRSYSYIGVLCNKHTVDLCFTSFLVLHMYCDHVFFFKYSTSYARMYHACYSCFARQRKAKRGFPAWGAPPLIRQLISMLWGERGWGNMARGDGEADDDVAHPVLVSKSRNAFTLF